VTEEELERIRRGVYSLRMSIRRKSKFSGIGSSAEIKTEPVIMGEIYRIIMSDGFQYFAAAE